MPGLQALSAWSVAMMIFAAGGGPGPGPAPAWS